MPPEWRTELLELPAETPNLDWLLLTKRHNLARHYLPKEPLPNVHIGMTIENEDMARLRLPYLGRIALDGWKTFISYEPALSRVNWPAYLDPDGLFGGCFHWLICGGESGSNARPMHPDWAREARDAATACGVPFFFKRWGAWLPWEPDQAPCWASQNGQLEDGHGLFPSDTDSDPRWDDGLWAVAEGGCHAAFQRVDKKAAGRTLDGREWNQTPLSSVGAA